ncbi:CheY-like chemotaxis protein [Mucilaginibacter oryzae]|uniref:CheY-like chemotaxis protein n=1 Tax=Mucilaginibacter oryzae TaxID=468058 RepID=A0A316HC94_9SPHI|nr:response regulator [Mucilaginibacter oryzae]PWK68307.1 CheY-like chemotaxis protein [Mucilaginibacter oryzae]
MNSQTYIIVVDDNPDDRDLVKRALPKRHTSKLREFDSEGDFRERFLDEISEEYLTEHNFPHLLFLDLRLEHNKSGIEILKEIRSNQYLKSIPVIMISSSDKDDDVMDAFLNGANLYVVKGEDDKVFTRTIKEILRSINRAGKMPSDVPGNLILEKYSNNENI